MYEATRILGVCVNTNARLESPVKNAGEGKNNIQVVIKTNKISTQRPKIMVL